MTTPEKVTTRFLALVVCAALSITNAGASDTVAPAKGSAELTRCNGFNSPEATWAAVAAGSEQPLSLRSLTPPVLLPDGSEFKTWEPAERDEPLRTFYVAQQHPQASDDNPGTEARPWKTIGRAAALLEPGDRVIVKQGVYREWVQPARGGTSPNRMITYQAAPNEEAILSGSEPLVGQWTASKLTEHASVAKAWMIDLPAALFGNYNPFAQSNVTTHMTENLSGMAKKWGWFKPPFTLSRGLIFQDDRRLVQVVEYEELAKAAGTYWVEPGGQRLHVRTFDDREPAKAAFEVTTRPFAFASKRKGLGFVRIDGFTVERVANCYPMPQLGAVSTMQGHHWIIENNVIRQVNALGLDYGRRQTFLPYLVPADTPKLAGVGTVVRRNAFYECGICSLSGLGLIGGLVEDNYASGCNWHRAWKLCETGGIKLHYLKNALVRRNLVQNTVCGWGLWVDHSIHNSRITQNLVFGSMCMEASYGPNLIDQNILWGSGLRLMVSGNAIITNNLINSSAGKPVYIDRVKGKRMLDFETKRMAASENNRVVGNVFYGLAKFGPDVPNDQGNVSDYNVFVNPSDKKPFDLEAWRKQTGHEAHSVLCVSRMELSPETWTLRQTPVLPDFQFPRIDEVTTDFFAVPRPVGSTTQAGPFLLKNRKPEMTLREAKIFKP